MHQLRLTKYQWSRIHELYDLAYELCVKYPELRLQCIWDERFFTCILRLPASSRNYSTCTVLATLDIDARNYDKYTMLTHSFKVELYKAERQLFQ